MKKKNRYDDPPVLRWKNKASFYASPDWIRLRKYKLTKDPLCQRCFPETLVPATEVHHKTDIKDDPSLSLDINNLESLCSDCHKSETMTRQHQAKKNAGLVTKFKFKTPKR